MFLRKFNLTCTNTIIKNSEIIFLDEATSALDNKTEKKIVESIKSLDKNITIIMIAHRLKTIQKCDQIFVIDNGKVADQGTFEELIEKNEVFKKMALHA